MIGCDEAGRGPLAGPLVVAALTCRAMTDGNLLHSVNDSKKLSALQREKLYEQVVQRPDDFAYNIAVIGPALIDEMNILQATLLGMQMVIDDLVAELGGPSSSSSSSFYAIVDGNKTPPKLSCSARPMVKADSLCYSVALASIMAKVTRDRLMSGEYHQMWPMYNFAKNKGYPTREHILLIHKHGPCPIHRLSYKPLKGRSVQQDLPSC